jgi:uncharacterized protein YnzC (UPF0291/DUF896 family)
MPHYFLHVNHADRRVEDLEGADFDSLAAAEKEAAAALRDLMASALIHGSRSTLESIEVADNEGQALTVVDIIDASATVFDLVKLVYRER